MACLRDIFVILYTHLYKDRTVCCNAPTVDVLMINYILLKGKNTCHLNLIYNAHKI